MRKPYKITPDAEQQVLGALKVGRGMAEAGEVIGVSRQALWLHMKKSPEFAEAVEEAKALADDIMQKNMYDSALAGDAALAKFWMMNRRPAEWRDRQEVALDAPLIEVRYADGVTAQEVLEGGGDGD